MIRKLLIAEPGGVAERIARTAKKLGLGTVAVHSEATHWQREIRSAEQQVIAGQFPAGDSHLKTEHLLQAAEETHADAIHPGYGTLSEDASLAQRCRRAGILFVGPSLQAIATVSNTAALRQAAKAAGVPIVPSSSTVHSVEEAIREARTLGFPVLLKPTHGGQDANVWVARSPVELTRLLPVAQNLAQAWYGDSSVYVEKQLPSPQHVEVQIAADQHGKIVHLGERACSIQRQHQTVLAEAPAPGLDPRLQREIRAAAIRLARTVSCDSLGTVKFLIDGGSFFFSTMSIGLRAEHAATEMLTGLDLVEWQLRMVMGEPLPALQNDISFDGVAIQCRIYAEDPIRGFSPSAGQIERFFVPIGPWVRNDVGVSQGAFVAPHYDPRLADLSVHAPDRATAIWRMREALSEYEVQGVRTNLEMHRRILEDEVFASGDVSTEFLRQRLGLES